MAPLLPLPYLWSLSGVLVHTIPPGPVNTLHAAMWLPLQGGVTWLLDCPHLAAAQHAWQAAEQAAQQASQVGAAWYKCAWGLGGQALSVPGSGQGGTSMWVGYAGFKHDMWAHCPLACHSTWSQTACHCTNSSQRPPISAIGAGQYKLLIPMPLTTPSLTLAPAGGRGGAAAPPQAAPGEV